MIFQQNVSFIWSCYRRLVLHILQSKLLAALPKARCIVHFSAAQREKSVSVSVRGSATGLLIAVEPKSSPGRRRFGGAENSSCQSPGCTWVPSNWVETVDNIPSTGAQIIHIFTGSQINSPRTAPIGRNLKTGTSFWQLNIEQRRAPKLIFGSMQTETLIFRLSSAHKKRGL